MKPESNWDCLSDRAQAFLGTTNPESQAGDSLQSIARLLDQSGCPRYQVFVDCLSRYAGIRLRIGTDRIRHEYQFASVQDHAAIIWDSVTNEPELMFCSEKNGQFPIVMKPNGSIVQYLS